MKKYLLITLALPLFFACSNPQSLPAPQEVILDTTPIVEHPGAPLKAEEWVSDSCPNSGNPCLVYGTSIGELFKTYYALNKIDEMVGITSKVSLEKFGEPTIRTLYKNMKFGYSMKFMNVERITDKLYVITYQTNITATKGRLLMTVFVEDGTAKIFINSLNRNNPFE